MSDRADEYNPTNGVRRPSGIRPLTVVLIVALVGLALFGQRAALELRLMRQVQADVPTEEFIEWARYQNDDLDRILKVLWESGKIAHRQEVLNLIRFPASPDQRLGSQARFDRYLREGVMDRDAIVRETALNAMMQSDHPESMRHTIASLADPDAYLRIVAMRILRYRKETNAIPLIARQLVVPDATVVCEAVNWLQRITGIDHGMKSKWISDRPGLTAAELKTHAGNYRRAHQKARDWWSAHQSEYSSETSGRIFGTPDVPLGEPIELESLPLIDRLERPVDFKAQTGKPLLLYFHTTWRAASGREIRHLRELHSAAGDRLAIVGVALDAVADEHNENQHSDLIPGADQNPTGFGHGHSHAHGHAHPGIEFSAIAKRVLQSAYRNKIEFPIVFDVESRMARVLQGGEVPAFVLLDSERRLIRRFTNARSAASILAMADLGSLDPE
jgi:hypothetical protein